MGNPYDVNTGARIKENADKRRTARIAKLREELGRIPAKDRNPYDLSCRYMTLMHDIARLINNN
ncbi:MAG: hypothetical protein WCT26_01670 [Candidatus Buchananbacteria bacterium]|jgi:hypothetical protein